MGKEVNRGGISVKQWGGAHVFTMSFTNMHFRVSPTGGVPTKLTSVFIYQSHSKAVANRSKCFRFRLDMRESTYRCWHWVVLLSEVLITLVTCAKAVI